MTTQQSSLARITQLKTNGFFFYLTFQISAMMQIRVCFSLICLCKKIWNIVTWIIKLVERKKNAFFFLQLHIKLTSISKCNTRFSFNQRSFLTCNPLGIVWRNACGVRSVMFKVFFGARFVYFGDHKLHINNVMFKSRLSSLCSNLYTNTIRHRDLDGERRNNNFNTLTWVLDRLKNIHIHIVCLCVDGGGGGDGSALVVHAHWNRLAVAHSHRPKQN